MVCLEHTTFVFDQLFSYEVPARLTGTARPGCRVLVPFGKGNRKQQGMILRMEKGNPDGIPLKPILRVLDEEPLLNDELCGLVFWMKDRYFCTLFEAVRLLLPAGMKYRIRTVYALRDREACPPGPDATEAECRMIEYLRSKKKGADRERIYADLELPEEDRTAEALFERGILIQKSDAVRNVSDAAVRMIRLTEDAAMRSEKCTARQQEIYDLLEMTGPVTVRELCYFTGVSAGVLNTMTRNGITEFFEQKTYRNPYADINCEPEREDLYLTDEQQTAYEQLRADYLDREAHVSLLYGITGSGKTILFLRLIDDAIERGDNVIVMVPEISLTPQTIARFHGRYGKTVAVFHSGLTLGQRLDEWKRVRSGEARIAVGTRSAVFAPFDRVGLIIMDEEQERSYKSEMSPRFHAREVAKYRCAYQRGLLVLASATPSIESAHAAQTGRYHAAALKNRYGKAKLPEVVLADLNEEPGTGVLSIYSEKLLRILKETLDEKEQAILLLNRRGSHPFIRCQSCRTVITCPNCSISLTYHSANHRMQCHYCGFSVPFSQECPVCHEPKVRAMGFGTQRAESELRELFPEARILRMDTDTAINRMVYEEKLNAFAAGEYDIMLGTQMVAKGLDFPNVTMVGVLSADQSLYSDDFRSSERTFDLLTQVVGRAGRGDKAGKAVIQTFSPENPILHLASQQNYPEFYRQELSFRKAMLYPPFVDLAAVYFTGLTESLVDRASREFLDRLSSLARREYGKLPMQVLQPAPALVAKVSGRYRYHLLIKCRNTRPFRELLARVLISVKKDRYFREVSVVADLSPDP